MFDVGRWMLDVFHRFMGSMRELFGEFSPHWLPCTLKPTRRGRNAPGVRRAPARTGAPSTVSARYKMRIQRAEAVLGAPIARFMRRHRIRAATFYIMRRPRSFRAAGRRAGRAGCPCHPSGRPANFGIQAEPEPKPNVGLAIGLAKKMKTCRERCLFQSGCEFGNPRLLPPGWEAPAPRQPGMAAATMPCGFS